MEEVRKVGSPGWICVRKMSNRPEGPLSAMVGGRVVVRKGPVKKGVLTRTQLCGHPDLKLSISRTIEIAFLLFKKSVCGNFFMTTQTMTHFFIFFCIFQIF